MKSAEQTLTEWINDAIVFKTAAMFVFPWTREQIEMVVDGLKKKKDMLVPAMFNRDSVHAYQFFPLMVLKEIYELLDKGAPLTAQEFAQFEHGWEVKAYLEARCPAVKP